MRANSIRFHLLKKVKQNNTIYKGKQLLRYINSSFIYFYLDPSEEKIFVSDLVFEMKKEPVKMVPVVSPLTILINESSNEKNPFLEYLKHEAHVIYDHLLNIFILLFDKNCN